MRYRWARPPGPRRRRRTEAHDGTIKQLRGADAATRNPRHRRLCRRGEQGRGRHPHHQAFLQRERARPEPARRRGLPGARQRAAPLSGRRLERAAPGACRALRPRRRAHRLRRRLRRADRPLDARLCRAGRRGDLQPTRLSHVSDRRQVGRRHPDRRARAQPDGRRRRAARRGDAAHPRRVSRQPEQSDRHLPAARRARASCATTTPPAKISSRRTTTS